VLSYAIGNIKSAGEFSCCLTSVAFSQFTPNASSGESFCIDLAEIIKIEIHDTGDEASCDNWYIHTSQGRHRININYGNPYRRFGEALQTALPHIKTIRT
jgi:hypothetical protein